MATTVLLLTIVAAAVSRTYADLDFFKHHELDISTFMWANSLNDNSTMGLASAIGCSYCGELFYYEPPPDDIMFMPPPPMHPNYQSNLMELAGIARRQSGESCNYCRVFTSEDSQAIDNENLGQDMNDRVVALLIAFLTISFVLLIYFITSRRNKIIASLSSSRVFKSTHSLAPHHPPDKTRSLNDSIANSGAHLTDPCFFQSSHDKNLTSPIISDQATHKKTSIPSKYWAQPGSIVGRTVRRIPNEYEFPSSRTNSTGTSSAVYADMNNENNPRFFSPYNLHTYAEVREVLDPNEPFQTSSNSSVMLSESNYDNAIYSHNNVVANGSVQMSDFNSSRPVHSVSYGPLHHPQHHNNQVYEHPPHRAQIIITSNNQGVNPTLLNYKDHVHNVI